VAALDVFVAHAGGRSFGDARLHLIRRNTEILNRHHPGYDALITAHTTADPLFAARRRMDALRWAEGRSRAGSILLVTHAEGGGVTEMIASRCTALREEGRRPIVLRPGERECRIDGFPNLRYGMPDELPALAALLRPDRPSHLEVHHLLGHDHAVLELADLLEVPVETWVHDYAALCPRIALVGRERRYCSEPELAQCGYCVADLGGLLGEQIAVPALLARSSADFAASRRVVVPTRDAAQRLRRHFPLVRPEIVPWEHEANLPPISAAMPAGTTRICVVGAIGVEKGYDVLLGCVRDARRRDLPLEFVVCGYTEDDERLLASGPVFVTGRYAADEAVPLIRAQHAHLALIPSVWPETWCFALSRAWQAGLAAVAFDLGAQAERIRATGRGHLLPLGLAIPAVNDALLRLAPSVRALHCPQP
jgi:glycosyltransferase involved in cell wall biosynthesis